MKFHALGLCLASALIASSALAAGSTRASTRSKVAPKAPTYTRVAQAKVSVARPARTQSKPRASYTRLAQADIPASQPIADRTVVTEKRTFYRAGTFYPEQYMYLREVIYPNMQSEEEVARKVTRIIDSQHTEIAHLTGAAPAAQAAGWTNVATVYEHMAQDHSRLATWAGDWLRERGFEVPPPPAAQTAAFESADASIDHVLKMHVDSFNSNLAMRQGEKSSTVRGLLLWAAASTARHISLLRTLDRDVDFGRRTVSARLETMMNGTITASEQTAMIDRIMTEETEYFRLKDSTTPPNTIATQIIEQVIEVEKPVERIVEVEKIVEKPVVVEKVVEKPVYVERVVEKRVYVNRPVRQNVAGRRQSIRARRPAK